MRILTTKSWMSSGSTKLSSEGGESPPGGISIVSEFSNIASGVGEQEPRDICIKDWLHWDVLELDNKESLSTD